MRATGAVVCALVLGVQAGCAEGAPGTGGHTEKVRTTVQTLLDACARGEGEAALDLLTEPAGEELIEADSVVSGCEDVLELGVESEVDGHTVFAEAVVESVQAEDDIATVTIRSTTGATSEVELENSGDQWLVSNPLVSG